MKPLTLIFIICLSNLTEGRAQFNVHEHRIQTFSVEDGLSQSSIWCMIQDSQGFMWFGTADGLNRFDGYTFKIFRHDPKDSTTIRSNTIWSLHEDRDGVLWVGTLKGLHRFDRRTETFRYLPDDSAYHSTHLRTLINTLVQDRDGNIWVGSTGGLSVLNYTTGTLREYRAVDFGWNGENQGMRAQFVDDAGDVWVSCAEHLLRYKRTNGLFVETRLPDAASSEWSTLFQDRAGTIWMGNAAGKNGLYALDRSKNSWQHWLHDPNNPASLSSNFVRTMTEDQEGRLWIGTVSGGVTVFDRKRNEFTRVIPQSDGANNTFYEKVSSICRDRSGLIWVGYDGAGIVKINPQRNKFLHVMLPPSKTKATGDNFFKALMVDRSDRVWLGMYNQGVAVLDRKSGMVQRFRSELSNPRSPATDGAFALTEDSRGSVWIGTLGGLYEFNPNTQRMHYRKLHGISPGDNRGYTITSLAVDSSGAVWVGSATNLYRYDREEEKVHKVLHISDIDSSIPFAGVLSVAVDRKNVWCGTIGIGLLRLTPEGQLVKQYKSNPLQHNSISHNSVKTICVDPDGILWIGTEDGLNRFDPAKETWRVYRSKDGLPNDFIYGVLMDHSRNLWISTNRGLSRMTTTDPDHPQFRNYTVNDGLQSFEFNTNTYFQTAQGELFFGGVNGFNSFFPDSVKDNSVLPRVVVTRFKKFDQPVKLDEDISVTKEVRLSYGESVFSLEFAALEFTDPEENRYAYMMEGFDKEWVYCGKRREARYTHLDPGDYTFRVKACNNDGVWNEKATSLGIVIVPPFWRTWWFFGLVLIVATGVFGGTVRYISTQKLKKKIEDLEREKAIQYERLRTRERIARDLHDDLASTVGSASFFIESVKNELKDIPRTAKEFLDKTSSLLTEAEESMSDIVWSVSPRHDTLESLLARVRLTTADMCKANGIKYEVTIPEFLEQLAMADEARREMYLIFKEALSNAARHSCATLIRVIVHVTPESLEMSIQDNGKGFPSTEHQVGTTKRGHGLRNMKKRAEEVGAELGIESAPGKGTTVRILKRMT